MENQLTDVAVKSKVGVHISIGSGIMLGLGAALISSYLMAGFLSFPNGGAKGDRTVTIYTTCGTYSTPGGVDGGVNQPFVAANQVDPDCGVNVCDQHHVPGCFMNGLPPYYYPPRAYVARNGGIETVTFDWFTDLLYNDNGVYFIENYTADAWKCLYNSQALPTCGAHLQTVFEAMHETHHIIGPMTLLPDKTYLFAVKNEASGQPTLISEVRSFTTFAMFPTTTCGTYTTPDGGVNGPIVGSGTVDSDCVKAETGNDVCHNGVPGNCFVGTALPKAEMTLNANNKVNVKLVWDTSLETGTNFGYAIPADAPIARPWECIWYPRAECSQYIITASASGTGTHHTMNISWEFDQNRVYYYAVASAASGHDMLKSEVRYFDYIPGGHGGASPIMMKQNDTAEGGTSQ